MITEESFDFEVAGNILDLAPKVMRRIRAEMRATAKPQITIAQLRIMSKLFRKICTITDLAERQGVSAPAMSKMIGVLEAGGLAKRCSIGHDRRNVGVKLTDEGQRILTHIRKAVSTKIAEKTVSLSQENKQTVMNALQALKTLVSEPTTE
jgi:DNA-binding MarR family transcriptional regulator